MVDGAAVKLFENYVGFVWLCLFGALLVNRGMTIDR